MSEDYGKQSEPPESPEWSQIGLPAHLTWGGNPMFWRSAIVTEARKSDSIAFAGRNLMRPFRALHTQPGVVLDEIMMLIDVPRERVAIVAFPSFLGPTVGAGVPMPTDEQFIAMRNGKPLPGELRVIGHDTKARDAAAAGQDRVLAQFGLRSISILGPEGNDWQIVLQEFDARADEVLDPDGHTLTQLGVAKVENLVEGTVAAAAAWVPGDTAAARRLQVYVERVSPSTGPSLQQSLAVGSPQQSGNYATTGRKLAQVEIRGSSQSGFLNNPTVRVYWNGKIMGELTSLGGRLVFEISSAGKLRLKSGLRSTHVKVGAGGATLHLDWDRIWGRLVATSEPFNGA